MNTEHIEKFVNAIACDLEEGGFRQVSGTTLRRSLTEAVSAALPLLADTGIPASQPAELAGQQGEGRERFEAWAETILGNNPNWRESGNGELARQAWQAALAATGKQQVGDDCIAVLSARIAFEVEICGSLQRVAKELGIDVGYLSRLARGEKTNPSDEVLEKLGLERTVTYTPIKRKYVASPLHPRTKSA